MQIINTEDLGKELAGDIHDNLFALTVQICLRLDQIKDGQDQLLGLLQTDPEPSPVSALRRGLRPEERR